MKIRAGGSFRAGGGALGQQGAPLCYSPLWETLYPHVKTLNKDILFLLIQTSAY